MPQSIPESMRYALVAGIVSAAGCAIHLVCGIAVAGSQLQLIQRAFDVAHSPLALIAATALYMAFIDVYQSRRGRRGAGPDDIDSAFK